MPILKVALPVPLPHLFDYLLPNDWDINQLQPGVRLRVPFRCQTKVGILFEIIDTSELDASKLRTASELLDSEPLLSPACLQLIQWVSHYYQHPIGEVVATALPTLLNQGRSTHIQTDILWQLTAKGLAVDNLPRRNRVQIELLTLLKAYPQGLTKQAIINQLPTAATSLRAMEKKGWVVVQTSTTPVQAVGAKSASLILNPAQQQAVQEISDNLQHFYPCLLDGVTGSGKTEVYLQIIAKVIEQGHQALILVPEINLTPQMIARFDKRFHAPIAVLHSKLTPKERLQNWLHAREGHARIVIGTRSAIWIPLDKPGIFIVDEEHDAAYKQQEGLRYSARDLAVVRARQANVPVILGSATPSFESFFNVQQRRYHHLLLPERAGVAVHPEFHIVDMRQQPKRMLSQQLSTAIQQRLTQHQQILLFINRRGYAPLWMCYECGWVAHCQHCDANLVYHDQDKRLQCHHCGARQSIEPRCPNCHQASLKAYGQGTERIETQLHQQFPQATVLRIDGDTIRSKAAMDKTLTQIHSGKAHILVGTQMLAKGHHFPQVTLVGVLNIDGGLFSVDFRASERVAQLLMQVAGRAGRADMPGEVIIQTYHPDHPLFTYLTREGYSSFAQVALQERQLIQLPPYGYLALLRAEAKLLSEALAFLNEVRQRIMATQPSNVQLWGPVPAPMEKRKDKYRAQLLFQANQRKALHQLLTHCIPFIPTHSNIHWSLDVDPQDLL